MHKSCCISDENFPACMSEDITSFICTLWGKQWTRVPPMHTTTKLLNPGLLTDYFFSLAIASHSVFSWELLGTPSTSILYHPLWLVFPLHCISASLVIMKEWGVHTGSRKEIDIPLSLQFASLRFYLLDVGSSYVFDSSHLFFPSAS